MNAGMRTSQMLWVKETWFIWTESFLLAPLSVRTNGKMQFTNGISLVHFISLFTNIWLLPFGLWKVLGSFVYN